MEQKDNTGVLFINNKKMNEKQPDYTGSAINGIKKDVSGWKKKSKNGDTYLSLSIKDPYVKGNSEWKSDIIEEKRDLNF